MNKKVKEIVRGRIETIIENVNNYDEEQGYEYIGELQFDRLINDIGNLIETTLDQLVSSAVEEERERCLQRIFKNVDLSKNDVEIIIEITKAMRNR